MTYFQFIVIVTILVYHMTSLLFSGYKRHVIKSYDHTLHNTWILARHDAVRDNATFSIEII